MVSSVGRSRIDNVASTGVRHVRFEKPCLGPPQSAWHHPFVRICRALLVLSALPSQWLSAVFAQVSDEEQELLYLGDHIAEWIADPADGFCSPVKY
jgi:hypothetical protein